MYRPPPDVPGCGARAGVSVNDASPGSDSAVAGRGIPDGRTPSPLSMYMARVHTSGA